MKLIDLIADVLKNASKPLVANEILHLLENHQDISLCVEYQRVKVKKSAVARCLTKYTTGANPIVSIVEEGKATHQRYFFNDNTNPHQPSIKEIDLHPILAQFAYERLGVYCKTIQATKLIKKNEKSMTWTNPDIVGIKPILLSWNHFFQKEVEKLGIFSTKVLEFYSFELKLKIDKSNLIENYFQAVSNSSWANHNYLVV